MIKSAKINLENGNKILIETKNQKTGNVYVKKVLVNGKEIKDNFFLHSDLVKGSHIVFYLDSKPSN